MAPNFCPSCGTRVRETSDEFCTHCGEDLEKYLSDDERDWLENDELRSNDADSKEQVSTAASTEPASSWTNPGVDEGEAGSGRVGAALVVVSGAIGGIAAYLGGLALWIWALFLLLEHWGFFFAAFAFFAFPLTAVVVVMCFFWGVPHFFVAFLAWLSAWVTLCNLDGRKRFAVLGAIGVVVFGSAAGYLAWHDAVTPAPISARDINQLTDDAHAVIAVLRASGEAGNDTERTIASVRTRAQLREELGKHDSARVDIIEEIVQQYLAYERSLEQDLMALFEQRARGESIPFKMSAGTRAALDRLPDRIRRWLVPDVDAMDELEQLMAKLELEDVSENWHELLRIGFRMRWSAYAATYEDVLGRPFPDKP